jgi:integrase
VLSKRSLLMIKSTLRRSIRRAQVLNLIGKNVAELVDLPPGRPGRPSRAMTEEQAGPRPGELRTLTWDLVDLDAGVIHVWRSASRSGDVKTPKSKRSLMLARRAAAALESHRKCQAKERLAAGRAWQDNNLVFCHEDGRPYTADALNWRFSKMTKRAGIGHWHAHEGRHTAVSIMSNNGVPIQDISDTVGHKSTHVTETVYRHVIAPAIRGGATVMDNIFKGENDTDDPSDERTAKNS